MADGDQQIQAGADGSPRRAFGARQRLWWRHAVVGGVNHQAVMATIADDSGWSPRYAFMILMSAGIAVLGLLVSSPAVVIGAMLISPLMNPILGFGFSLATFDFAETRRSLLALAAGSVLAIAFTALIVLASPLKEATAEILARTRPNLFDLLVALFAALAGTFAIIKGREGTIVGVAIATALMPPLAVVGYGLATWNVPVLGGSLALFGTNFIMIALAATIMARLYGFGPALSAHQGWIQSGLLALVFVTLAVPLGLSLSRIAGEAVAVTEIRGSLTKKFGPAARITQLAVDFDAKPIAVSAVVITPQSKPNPSAALRTTLEKTLGRPLTLQVDQVFLARNTNSLEAQRTQLQAANDAASVEKAAGDQAQRAAALASGVSPEAVLLDREHRKALATAIGIPGAGLAVYHALEERAGASAPDWQISIVPPFEALPAIRFKNRSDAIDDAARQAVLLSAWAARRWNVPALAVPGYPLVPVERPRLAQRRGLAVAAILQSQTIQARPAPAAGFAFRLAPMSPRLTP
jgi:uncharacterized hydrophobic protein (TIGR00271 family)